MIGYTVYLVEECSQETGPKPSQSNSGGLFVTAYRGWLHAHDFVAVQQAEWIKCFLDLFWSSAFHRLLGQSHNQVQGRAYLSHQVHRRLANLSFQEVSFDQANAVLSRYCAVHVNGPLDHVVHQLFDGGLLLLVVKDES